VLDAFDYDLPIGAIAQRPVEPRDSSRLLVATADGAIEHRHVSDLPEFLRPGDVVVINDSRVVPARLAMRKATGGVVEVLLLEPWSAVPTAEVFAPDATWVALVRPGRRVRSGTPLWSQAQVVDGPDGPPALVVGDELSGGRRLVTMASAADVRAASSMPLPPYITEVLDEPERYQTVYAAVDGSAAAPTAGLHFTNELLARCERAGATVHRVELHVGLDTFRPVTVADPADHVMHSERYVVPPGTWEAVSQAHEAGGRVIAVGTTSVRALEAAAQSGALSGRTDLFIRRPFSFACVDLLMTNFHLPRTTLLMMIDAFVGPRWRELYSTALASGYRFLSFGDAMLLERAHR
jgi:S-adenosylmethionine:tRNA ribosyltransferase-isomerase